MSDEPKGARAGQLRRRKAERLRRLQIPPDALPGSLALTHTKCGKPSCHCATGEGHPGWQLTYVVDGQKRVERVPTDWVDEVRRRLAEGHIFKKTLAEVWDVNVQLLALARRQRRSRRR